MSRACSREEFPSSERSCVAQSSEHHGAAAGVQSGSGYRAALRLVEVVEDYFGAVIDEFLEAVMERKGTVRSVLGAFGGAGGLGACVVVVDGVVEGDSGRSGRGVPDQRARTGSVELICGAPRLAQLFAEDFPLAASDEHVTNGRDRWLGLVVGRRALRVRAR